jgi:hypothetical protein
LAASFKVATGHSPHIVRTLAHDALAKYGAYGADLALVLCGQNSPETAKHYEYHAERHRFAEAQKELEALQRAVLIEKVGA